MEEANPAAKRRKYAALGASRGWRVADEQAPEGRKNGSDPYAVKTL